MSSCKKTLHDTPLGTLIFDKKDLIQVELNDSIEDTIELLRKSNILSAPVYDNSKKQYVGIVDMFDIMTSIAFGSFKESEQKEGEKQDLKFSFKDTRVSTLIDTIPKTRSLTVFEPAERLESLIQSMGDMCVQRILVKQHGDSLTSAPFRLLSQSDVVRFIMNNMSEFGKFFESSVDEFGFAFEGKTPNNLILAPADAKAVDVFRRMWTEGVYGVGVIDKNGKLIANLSATDVRGIAAHNIKSVDLPVIDFLNLVHNGKAPKPVTCDVKTPMTKVIQSALSAKIHRVWVVNSDQKPIGVITFSDIISSLGKQDRR